MLYIDTVSYTHPGGHKINEDSFCRGRDFFAVADGLGGHVNGEDASRCAIEYFKNNAHGNYSDETVKSLLEGANAEVCGQASGARTTIAVLFAENGIFRYANVGDSRVYIFRDDRVLAMTKDHSVCRAAVDMGTMEFDEIRRSEDRSKLLKVLGNDVKLNVPKGYPPIQMQEGDAFLICSDGFWDYVLESEMEADLLKSDSPQKWLSFMLKRHIAAAMNKGDNYTAICGMVKAKQDTAYAAPEKRFPILWIILAAIAAVIVLAAGMINLSKSKVTEQESVTSTVSETIEMTEESEEVSGSTEPDRENYNPENDEPDEAAEENETDLENDEPDETAEENETDLENGELEETAEENETDPENGELEETAEENETDLENGELEETAEENETDPESDEPDETAEENETDLENGELEETAEENETDLENGEPDETAEENETDLENGEPDNIGEENESGFANNENPITNGILSQFTPIM